MAVLKYKDDNEWKDIPLDYDNYVKKTGDTISGALHLDVPLEIASGGTGSNSIAGARYNLIGNVPEISGDANSDYIADGKRILFVYSTPNASNGAIYMRPAKDFIRYLGNSFVNNTGDTMTGNLTINKTSDPSITLTNQYGNSFRIHANGSSAGNGSFWIYNTSAGSNSFTISESTNTVSLAKPLPIGSGGTGATAVSGMTSQTTKPTVNGGATVTAYNTGTWGKIFMFSVKFKLTSAMPSGYTRTITFPSSPSLKIGVLGGSGCVGNFWGNTGWVVNTIGWQKEVNEEIEVYGIGVLA